MDFQKQKKFFLTRFQFKKKIHEKKKVFFVLAISDFRAEKKVFATKKGFFFINFRFEMWQIPALLQASLDFPQLEGALVSLWLISLHAQDGALFQPPNRKHTVEQRPAQLKT